MVGSSREFTLTMMDPKMFIGSHVDQAILPSPSVGVNEALRIGPAPDDRLENCLARIGNNFRVDPIAALQKSEDDRFATGASAPPPPDSVRSEVGLVRFQVPIRGDSRSQASASLCLILGTIAFTVRVESPVKAEVSVVVRSMAKHRTRGRKFASEIFENAK